MWPRQNQSTPENLRSPGHTHHAAPTRSVQPLLPPCNRIASLARSLVVHQCNAVADVLSRARMHKRAHKRICAHTRTARRRRSPRARLSAALDRARSKLGSPTTFGCQRAFCTTRSLRSQHCFCSCGCSCCSLCWGRLLRISFVRRWAP
jgi:hypothetical protein